MPKQVKQEMMDSSSEAKNRFIAVIKKKHPHERILAVQVNFSSSLFDSVIADLNQSLSGSLSALIPDRDIKMYARHITAERLIKGAFLKDDEDPENVEVLLFSTDTIPVIQLSSNDTKETPGSSQESTEFPDGLLTEEDLLK
jgi:hypothetical protein